MDSSTVVRETWYACLHFNHCFWDSSRAHTPSTRHWFNFNCISKGIPFPSCINSNAYKRTKFIHWKWTKMSRSMYIISRDFIQIKDDFLAILLLVLSATRERERFQLFFSDETSIEKCIQFNEVYWSQCWYQSNNLNIQTNGQMVTEFCVLSCCRCWFVVTLSALPFCWFFLQFWICGKCIFPTIYPMFNTVCNLQRIVVCRKLVYLFFISH